MSGDTLPVEGQECCILEICCWDEKSANALAFKIETADLKGIGKKEAYAIAEWIRDRYTLVPKGLLTPFIQHYATMARAYPLEDYDH